MNEPVYKHPIRVVWDQLCDQAKGNKITLNSSDDLVDFISTIDPFALKNSLLSILKKDRLTIDQFRLLTDVSKDSINVMLDQISDVLDNY